MILPHSGQTPRLSAGAFVADSAQVIGEVTIGEESSIWFQAVLRGDVHWIRIGARSNVQDHATIHVTTGTWPTVVGDDVTIGHAAVLHGCTVGNLCLVGIGAIVLDGARLEDECLIGAGALVTPGTVIPSGHLALGQPAKPVRPLRAEERQHLRDSAARYVALAREYQEASSTR